MVAKLLATAFYLYFWLSYAHAIFEDDNKYAQRAFDDYTKFTGAAKSQFGVTLFDAVGPLHPNFMRVYRWTIVRVAAYFILVTVSLIVFVRSKAIRRLLSTLLALLAIGHCIVHSGLLIETKGQLLRSNFEFGAAQEILINDAQFLLAAGIGYLIYC